MLCFPEVFQQIRIALVKLLFESGFYLGYLRGGSLPPKNPQLPSKKFCYHYS